jgi:solute carrier family 25 protein 33/36
MSNEAFKHVIYGGTAGAVGALITSPLEVIKTRLQSQHQLVHSQNSSSFHLAQFTKNAMQEVVQREGIKGLWKGIGPTVIGSIPSRAIYFSLYNLNKKNLTSYVPSSHWLHFLSAFNAGIITNTFTSPIWMIKTRLQLNTSKDANRSSLILKDILKKEGVTALWKGVGASYLGVFETALQWVLYEKMKDQASTPVQVFGFASISKLCASLIWYPHEVIRTRMREPNANYRHFIHCLKSILQNEGWKKLYSGLAIHLFRVVPNSAIIFLTFELLTKKE